MKKQMTQKTKNIISVLVILIAAAGATTGYLYNKKHHPVPQGAVSRTDALSGLVKGFPSSLVVDPKAVINQSFATTYPKYTRYTTFYTSTINAADLVGLYTQLFSKGYVIHQASQVGIPGAPASAPAGLGNTDKPVTITASSPDGKTAVSVSIASHGSDSYVSVSEQVH